MTHTPGPWFVDGWNVYSESAKSEVGTLHNYFAVAQVAVRSGSLVSRSIPKDEATGNAHLIAAAPEMLAFLKKWEAFNIEGSSSEQDEYETELVRLISKAEGRES